MAEFTTGAKKMDIKQYNRKGEFYHHVDELADEIQLSVALGNTSRVSRLTVERRIERIQSEYLNSTSLSHSDEFVAGALLNEVNSLYRAIKARTEKANKAAVNRDMKMYIYNRRKIDGYNKRMLSAIKQLESILELD